MTERDLDRFHRIEEIFDAALEHPSGPERDAFLRAMEEAEGADPSLLAEARQLLQTSEGIRASSPAEPERLPRFGPWQAIRVLGRGGMGTVYLAERADGAFQMSVAVKVVPLAMASQGIEERFRRERQFLASLDHPKIARLIDGGVTGAGLPYLVMDFVDGSTIDRYCETHQLDLRARVALMRQALEALAYVHSQRVIHGDLKPSNILVDAAGNAKLVDFGLAKLVDASGETAITKTGVFALTPEYASPEQAAGEPLTFSSDIYSAGVLLYRLLTGRSPYRVVDQSPAEVSRTIRETPPEPAPELGEQLDAVLSTALRKNPEERYRSAADMDADLARYLAGEPVLARPPAKSRRTATLLTAAAAILVVVAGAGWWWAHGRTVAAPTASITILPFVSINTGAGGDSQGQSFADALTQDFASEIVHNKTLHVTPQTAAAIFRKQPRDVQEVGRRLKTSHVLEATVERSGERVKIVASLERTSDGAKLWTNTYQRLTADFGAIEIDLEAGILKSLGVAAAAPRKRHVPPEQARAFLLKARDESDQGSPSSNAAAQQDYRRALELDPDYTAAYQGLASTIWNRSIEAGERPVMAEQREAEQLYQKALQIDPDFLPARISLVLYAMQYDWDWKRAEREVQTVLAAGPNPSAEQKAASLYQVLGRHDEAEAHMRSSLDLDSLGTNTAANFEEYLYLDGRLPEAREQAFKLSTRYPKATRWQVEFNFLDGVLGKVDPAIQNLRKLSQTQSDAVVGMAQILAAAGRRDEALAIVRPLEKDYEHSKFQLYDFAAVYGEMGDVASAVKWLERSMEAREMPAMYIHVDPAFAKMQDTPEFHRLKKRMNLDW